ncbi:hypothetical protein D3C87_1929180 [compost metagenome]
MVHSHGHISLLHPTMNDHAKGFVDAVIGAFFGGIVGNPAEFFCFMQTSISIFVQTELRKDYSSSS